MKKKYNLRNSFNYAISGIIEAIKTEMHMKVHLITTLVVVVLSFLYGVSKDELIQLLIVITLVWLAELINTAIESSIDIVCKSYHPLAKKAKDVAAGAVLVTAINALVVGYLIFHKKLTDKLNWTFDVFKGSYQHTLILILAIVVVVVFIVKSVYKKGTPLKGGMPSGHSAIASSLWVIVAFISNDIKIFFITLALMLLVIQSRIEGRIHTLKETFVGALFGASITYLILLFLKG